MIAIKFIVCVVGFQIANTILLFILFGARVVCHDTGVETASNQRTLETIMGKKSRSKTNGGKDLCKTKKRWNCWARNVFLKLRRRLWRRIQGSWRRCTYKHEAQALKESLPRHRKATFVTQLTKQLKHMLLKFDEGRTFEEKKRFFKCKI